jgi:prepilin peptidase CpaA
MAMIGAYLGPLSTLEAVIATLIAGGVLGIAMAVWKRSTAKAFRNVQLIMTNMMMKLATNESAPTNMAAASAGKLPYAVAIAAGTATHMLLLRNGYALII